MAFIEKTMHNFLGMSDFTNAQKASCVLWLAEFHDVKKVQSHFKVGKLKNCLVFNQAFCNTFLGRLWRKPGGCHPKRTRNSKMVRNVQENWFGPSRLFGRGEKYCYSAGRGDIREEKIDGYPYNCLREK